MGNHTDHSLHERQENRQAGWTDAFEDLVAKGTRNAIDLPAFYDFSEERYRFIENGSRVRNPNADSTRFTDQDQQFLLEPEAGDTLEFKTAEKPRYVVGNDADVSWAFKFLSGLVDADDSFTLFLEGAFEIEYSGDGSVSFRTLEDGTEKEVRSVDIPVDTETPTRPELEFNWYAVGRAKITIDYTEDNEQKKTEPVTLTVDDDWLSDDPTGRFGFRLDVANPGIQLEAGSMAYIVKSSTPPTSRAKPHVLNSSDLNQIGADGYTALGALRVDPERDNVYTTLSEMSITAEQSVDVEVWLSAVPPSETDADFADPDDDGTDEGPAYPRNNSPQNSVVQFTPNVSTFPTRTYAVTGDTIPNGRNIGVATESASGEGAGTRTQGRAFLQKRPVYSDDVVVIIGRTPDESQVADVDLVVGSNQDW